MLLLAGAYEQPKAAMFQVLQSMKQYTDSKAYTRATNRIAYKMNYYQDRKNQWCIKFNFSILI